VDTEGFVLRAQVHSAKMMDHEGIKTLLRQAEAHFPRFSHLWLDAGYRGEDKVKDWALRRPWQSVQPKQLLFAELGKLFEPRVSGPGERTAGLASPGGRSSFSRRSCRTFSTLVPHQTTPLLATYGNDPKSQPTDPKI
jgi:hypothetical protein